MNKFKKVKRAYYSLLIIAGLYFVSLFSEFIANDNPLIMRFGGKYYFPVIKFYPENKFIPSGNKTRVDYKKLKKSEAFKKDKTNFMLFPIIPYGPNEIEDTEHGLSKNIDISLKKMNLVFGSVRIDQFCRILKIEDNITEIFENSEEKLFNMDLKELLDKNSAEIMKELIKNRYEGKISNSVTLNGTTHKGKSIILKLSTFSGGEISGSGIKVRISEGGSDDFSTAKISIDSKLKILKFNSKFAEFIGVKNINFFVDFNKLIDLSRISNKSELLNLITKKMLSNNIETEKIKITVNKNLNEYDEFELYAFKEKMKFPYKPTTNHLFGIDDTGRDIFARLLYGFRISMSFALILSVSAMFVGIIVGGIQGYAGGLVDISFQRFTEIWSAIPFLYVIILLGDLFGKGFNLLLVCYAIFNWIGISYYIRGEFLRLKKFQFVEAAKSLGLPWYKIIFRHILPNSLTPVVTFFPFSLMSAIVSLSALDYLGYGLPAPTPSWGELLGQAQSHRDAWWLIIYPAASLFFTMLLTVFIGEGVRDVFDTRKKIKYE